MWEGRWFFMATRALVLLVWRCLWTSSLLCSHPSPCCLSRVQELKERCLSTHFVVADILVYKATYN